MIEHAGDAIAGAPCSVVGAEQPARPPAAPSAASRSRVVSAGRGSRALIGFIQIYQLVRIGRVSPCRFTPTCSQYAVEALCRHGVTRGLRLTAGRLVRCRPGGPFGADPVPE